MRMFLGARLAASALATALLLGAGQGLVAETVIYSNNPVPGDWVGGSTTSVPLVGAPGWSYNTQGDGHVGIRVDEPYLGNGSVLMRTTSTSGAANIELINPDGFGQLKDLEAFSYTWMRLAGSTAIDWAGPVARLLITNGTQTGYLVWEQYFNGFTTSPPTEGVWITSNAYNNGNGQFSTYSAGSGGLVPNNLRGADATFDQWVNGSLGWMPQSYGDFTVIGINIGMGSGLEGTLIGAADNLTLKFAGQDATTYNFEVSPVPEPSSIVLSVIGAGALGLICHRRRRGGATA